MARERHLRSLVKAERGIRDVVKAREAFNASGLLEFAVFIGELHPKCRITLSEGDLNTFPSLEIRGPVGRWQYGKVSMYEKEQQLQANQGRIKIVHTDKFVIVTGDRVVLRQKNNKAREFEVGMSHTVRTQIEDKSIFREIVDVIKYKHILDPNFGPDSKPIDLSKIIARAKALASETNI